MWRNQKFIKNELKDFRNGARNSEITERHYQPERKFKVNTKFNDTLECSKNIKLRLNSKLIIRARAKINYLIDRRKCNLTIQGYK